MDWEEREKNSIKLIQYWSSLEHTTNHREKKSHTGLYLNMIGHLSSLQNGTFYQSTFDSHWIEKEEIPNDWFTKEWSYQELKDGLDEAYKYCLEGYSPKHKKWVRSLKNILYDYNFGKSLLLSAMKNPPKRIEIWEPKLPETAAKLMKNPIWKKNYKFTQERVARLDDGLVELKEFSDNLIRDRYNRSHEYFGSLAKLLKEYIAWIEEQDWMTDMNVGVIGTKNKLFKWFIKAQEKEIGIKIKSKVC